VRRLETLALGLAFALLVLGISLVPLTQPAFTRVFSARYALAEDAGLSGPRMLEIAEQVRVFVTDADAPALPATVNGRPGFDAAAVSHLVDVRNVLLGAQLLTGILAGIVTLWLAVEVARRRTERIAAAMHAGAITSVALVGIAALAGVFDFERLFSAFHTLFFSAGTWTFPYDSLLIQTFPEPFWITGGLAWGGLVLAGAGLLELGSRWVRGSGTARSATPEDARPDAGAEGVGSTKA